MDLHFHYFIKILLSKKQQGASPACSSSTLLTFQSMFICRYAKENTDCINYLLSNIFYNVTKISYKETLRINRRSPEFKKMSTVFIINISSMDKVLIACITALHPEIVYKYHCAKQHDIITHHKSTYLWIRTIVDLLKYAVILVWN